MGDVNGKQLDDERTVWCIGGALVQGSADDDHPSTELELDVDMDVVVDGCASDECDNAETLLVAVLGSDFAGGGGIGCDMYDRASEKALLLLLLGRYGG